MLCILEAWSLLMLVVCIGVPAVALASAVYYLYKRRGASARGRTSDGGQTEPAVMEGGSSSATTSACKGESEGECDGEGEYEGEGDDHAQTEQPLAEYSETAEMGEVSVNMQTSACGTQPAFSARLQQREGECCTCERVLLQLQLHAFTWATLPHPSAASGH